MHRLWVLVTALCVWSSASALDEEQKRKQGERWFKAYDADFDGFISRQEYIDVELKKIEKRFEFIDTTKDGYISSHEAKSAYERREKIRRLKERRTNSDNNESETGSGE
jgi:Ca2+-binding EF-hand superfamily protein